jgi:hypothetical protein
VRERLCATDRAQTLSVHLHLLTDPMSGKQVHQLAAAMNDLGTDLTLRVRNMYILLIHMHDVVEPVDLLY